MTPRYSFSRDGKWLVLGCDEVKALDLETGRERFTLTDIPGGVFDVSAADSLIALGCEGKVLVCDSMTGKVRHTFAQAGYITSVVLTANGKRLAACGNVTGPDGTDRRVNIRDLETGKEMFSRKVEFNWSMAISSDAKHLAMHETTNDSLELWDAETGKTLWSLPRIQSAIDPVGAGQKVAVSFSPNNKQIACMGIERLFVLDAATGKIQKSFKINDRWAPWFGRDAFGSDANVLAYLPDGEHVIVGAGIWNLNHVSPEKFLCKDLAQKNTDSASGHLAITTFSGDGKRIIACAGTSSAQFGQVEELLSWDAQTGQQNRAIARKKGPVNSQAFSGNGQRIAFCCPDGSLHIWDTEAGQELIAIAAPAAKPFEKAVLSDDGTWVATSDGKRITIWDVRSGALKQTFTEYSHGIGCIAISADGKRIAFSDESLNKERPILIWDVNTGRQLRACTNPHDDVITCLAFSPDGGRLVAGNAQNLAGGHEKGASLTMWETTTGRVLHVLKGHTNNILCAAFSSDGKRLATGSFDRTVRLWDVDTGQQVLTIKLADEGDPLTASNSVAFSRDGKLLTAGTNHKTVTVWEAP